MLNIFTGMLERLPIGSEISGKQLANERKNPAAVTMMTTMTASTPRVPILPLRHVQERRRLSLRLHLWRWM